MPNCMKKWKEKTNKNRYSSFEQSINFSIYYPQESCCTRCNKKKKSTKRNVRAKSNAKTNKWMKGILAKTKRSKIIKCRLRHIILIINQSIRHNLFQSASRCHSSALKMLTTEAKDQVSGQESMDAVALWIGVLWRRTCRLLSIVYNPLRN